jgi:rhamnulokinase
VIYRSLADCYGRTLAELEEITGRKFQKIHIVGGGSHADYLNRLTADAAGRPCLCGPAEGTAIGNILVQMMRDQIFSDMWEARTAVRRSFEIREFSPNISE